MANTKNTREARFRVIETLLLWEGQVDNRRLRSLLDIQNVQASRVLAEYAEQNADQILRLSPRSPYQASSSTKPSFSSGSIDEYLALIQGTEDLGEMIEDVRMDLTAPAPRVFSVVFQACRRNLGLTIQYRSMNNPRGSARLIYPHAIVRAGRRWHVRAWCTERQDFRDFAIGRIHSASISAIPKPDIKADVAWNTKLPLVLSAHPALTLDQCRVIRDEYFSGSVSRQLTIRSCVLTYVIQDLRAAVDPKKETPPDFQLVVSNAKNLKPYLFVAKR